MDKTRAAILHGPKDLRLEYIEVSEPREKEVLLSVQSCGICCTDVHMWHTWTPGQFGISQPFIPGHESSAIVEAIGPEVTNLVVGDRVAVELDLPCRQCEFCKTGRGNLCKGFSKGSFSQRRIYNADFCHRLPDIISHEQAALLEPLAVAIHAAHRAEGLLGRSVLVVGSGTIGLSLILVVKAMGAQSVYVADIQEKQLNLAKKFGADKTILIGKNASAEESMKNVLSSSSGAQVDVAFECSGSETGVPLALKCTARGGCVILVGIYNSLTFYVPLQNHTVRREIDVRGSFGYTSKDYKASISLLTNKTPRDLMSSMISHRYPLSEINSVFHEMNNNPTEFNKVILDCQN